jgi:hypothetical protein
VVESPATDVSVDLRGSIVPERRATSGPDATADVADARKKMIKPAVVRDSIFNSMISDHSQAVPYRTDPS